MDRLSRVSEQMGIVDSKTIAHFEFAKRSTRVFADESALYLNKQ